MPSSGTTVYTINRDNMITDVLRSIRVLVEGTSASGTQLTDATDIMNMVIKEWTTSGLKLWTYNQIQVPMVANQYVYTLGITGADVTLTFQPLRMFETGNFIRQTIGGLPYDTPLQLISRDMYMQFGAKASTGVPNSIYYEPGIVYGPAPTKTSPGSGYGTLYVYVAPFDGTRTLFLNAQRALQDVTAGTDEFDMPQEWFMALRSALRYHLGDYYEVPEDRLKRYAAEMKSYFDAAQDWSVEEASSQFGFDQSGGWRS